MRTRVLVLGGDGMLGSMVVRVLGEDAAVEVFATSRSRAGQRNAFSSYDVSQGSRGLVQVLEETGRVDYLVNCIGFLAGSIDQKDLTTIQQAIQVNSVLPYQVAEVAAKFDSRVISISTDAVFAVDSGSCSESKRPDAIDIYGRTKLLGEVIAPQVLNVRCSIIGPSPQTKRGLFEWVRSQKEGATISGFTNQRWNGVTTLQYARLVASLLRDSAFDQAREESALHHFCPNQPVTKFELVRLIAHKYRKDLTVCEAESPQAVSRILDSEYRSLTQQTGSSLEFGGEIDKLAPYCNPV